MQLNFLIIAVSALVPLILGFIWYHPKVFGTAWMNASGLTEESMKNFNMAKVFSLTFVLSFLAGLAINFVVIHQWHFFSILAEEPGLNDAGTEMNSYFTAFMEKYGRNFRTFKHGVFHGTLTGIFLVLPVIGINAMFERKTFKYIMINTGFWVICMALMGGIICQFA